MVCAHCTHSIAPCVATGTTPNPHFEHSGADQDSGPRRVNSTFFFSGDAQADSQRALLILSKQIMEHNRGVPWQLYRQVGVGPGGGWRHTHALALFMSYAKDYS
jgi:hypothetical protein